VTTRRRPLALRTRLLLLIVSGVGLTLVLLIVVFNVALARSLDNDADEIVEGRAQSELAALIVEDGRIVPPEDVVAPRLETRAWVFEGTVPLRRPPADEELDGAAVALVDSAPGTSDLGSRARLYALPVLDENRRIGTIVSAISLEAYNRTRFLALVASTALGILVLSAVAAASALILRAALRPVSRMTADAAAWSEGDLDNRFAVGPPHDEITNLAATLDGLMDRLAAGMRRERRLTAEVSHELRTPLAQIRAEADLGLRRDRTPEEYRAALEVIRAGAERIEATVETLIATARQETLLPRGTGDPRDAAVDVIAACTPLADDRGIELVLRGEPDVRAGVETPVVERILQPVVENACRFARARVTVTVADAAPGVVIEVRDDGPGVADGRHEAIFEPGVQDAGDVDAHRRGAGLGLPLSRRLARAAGGDVTAHHPPTGGGAFTVSLPAA